MKTSVPVLMCDKCMSTKPDKNPATKSSVRCSLCVKEGVTIPANDIELTANGIGGKISKLITTQSNNNVVAVNPQQNSSSGNNQQSQQDININRKDDASSGKGKAARSVLKWGGGHAYEKKGIRKMKRILCQFGTECARKDCYFAHPKRKSSGNQIKFKTQKSG